MSTPPPPNAAVTFAIVNALIRTGDRRRPWADGILVRDGVIVAIGSSAEVKKSAGSAIATVDAKRMVVTPSAERGTLVAGAPADIVMFDRDITRTETDGRARLMLAVTDGRVAFDRDGMIS